MSETHDKQSDDAVERPIVSEFTDGGHEIDRPPAMTLFGFLAAMGVIIVVSAIGVYQLFVSQSDKEASELATRPVTQRVEQEVRDDMYMTTYGVITDEEGAVTGYRMPIEKARQLVLEQPARFAPAPPPAGWTHPDDAAAAPAPEPKE